MEYYTSMCRNCYCDCDGEFCSWECQQEYEEGLGDYLYERERDRQLDRMEADYENGEGNTNV